MRFPNRILSLTLLGLCALLAFGTQANALLVQPGNEIASGPETSNDEITKIVEEMTGVTECYKSDDPGIESGPLAGSYDTTFIPPGDPEGADIVWTGPGVATETYLLVKDGRQDPAWYLFDLDGWDGMETLELRNFWPAQGAISHVSLYCTPVPEPSTILLLGAGLIGLTVYSRRKFRTR
jgi:hypothetical protein